MRRVVIFIWLASWLFPSIILAAKLDAALMEQGITLDSLIRAQAFYSRSSINDTSFNPGNQLARLNDAEFILELRPDFSLSYQNLEFMLKPRFQYAWEQIDTTSGPFDQDESSAYINEWRMRLGLRNQLFLSYGREVLLWGPAMLLSPSNPFFVDNGRSNPYRELGGRDYLQATYLANSNWTFSLISNTAQGRGEDLGLSEFDRTDAVKVDYVGQSGYGSLIFSHQQDGLSKMGGFFQLTLSDALLVYAEGGYSQGTPAFYPYRTPTPPGWSFVTDQRDDNKLFGISLVGLAYTFEAGPTLNVEFIYNNAGYSDQEARDYFAMAEQLDSGFAGSGLAATAPLLAQAANPRLPLLRRNYLFVQLLNTNIRNQLDVTLRYTRNLDDDSGNFVSVFDWAVNDFTHLFALGLVNHGDEQSEFRRYLDNQWLIGINLTF